MSQIINWLQWCGCGIRLQIKHYTFILINSTLALEEVHHFASGKVIGFLADPVEVVMEPDDASRFIVLPFDRLVSLE